MVQSGSATGTPHTVPAGRLAPWTVGDLPPAPGFGWRQWAALIGPGVLMAGASIGSGEWLAGPGVTAQYGGTLLWVATLSIVAQVFCNIEFMRYALYCGEPIMVGGMRTWPGPLSWAAFYVVLEFAHIWPFNVANAAVPVASALLGHLPGDGQIHLLGLALSEHTLVKTLACILFLLAFVPLIFGGTIYKTLERIMTAKLVVVLVFLSVVGVLLVSARTAHEVIAGFFRFGQVPLRAETIIDGRHFTLTERDGSREYTLRGTVEDTGPLVTDFRVRDGDTVATYGIGNETPDALLPIRQRMLVRAVELAQPGRFYLAQTDESAVTLSAEGRVDSQASWHPERITVTAAPSPSGATAGLSSSAERTARAPASTNYTRVADVPQPQQNRLRELLDNHGLHRVQLINYVRAHGRLPNLDWAMIATFASIAGAGGLTNVLLSNYARDKGWGMGARVGAIASAVGGRKISLSHVGQVFRLTDENRHRWRGWMRHILRDQAVVWMLCCFVGMALPCMMSIEFIRNAPVSGDRVAAMTADGMAHRYPGSGLWAMTLFVGFLVLYPGQIMSGDTIPRRWCDMIWSGSSAAHRLSEDRVKYIYYGIMAVYAAWGLVALILVGPLEILKIGGVLMNFALGASALHALYINRTLLPRELRPNWFMQSGVVFCGLFFFTVSAVGLVNLMQQWQ